MTEESDALRHTGRAGFLGAMFLMATSAIGPGFLTQTTTFTVQLGAAFAFVILVTVIVDIAIQLNVWRIIGISGRRAQDLANHALPGAGFLLAALDVFGGIVFNIGNIAGCSLGLEALFGLDVRVGGVISAVVAIAVFLVRRAGVAMDRVVILLGVVMLALTTYVAIITEPPVGDALKQSVHRTRSASWRITTLIGGTVGGYIVYAGAHRLVDNGVKGVESVKRDHPGLGPRHRHHRRDAGRAVPRGPRRGHRRREDRRGQPHRLGVRRSPGRRPGRSSSAW